MNRHPLASTTVPSITSLPCSHCGAKPGTWCTPFPGELQYVWHEQRFLDTVSFLSTVSAEEVPYFARWGRRERLLSMFRRLFAHQERLSPFHEAHDEDF